MIYGSDRTKLRQVFLDTWLKYQNQQPLEPLEEQLAALLVEHPEYHALLNQPAAVEKDFHIDPGADNPFLHLAMHLSIREQIALDRPKGIEECYITLCKKTENHEAEHRMMAILGEALWQAQRDGAAPDELEYLRQLQRAAQSDNRQ